MAGGTIDVGLAIWGTNSKDVSGNVDVTASTSEAENAFQTLTGTLTGNINYILPPDAGKLWLLFNNTSGAFAITVKTPAGTGIVVAQGKRAVLASDGVNIVRWGPDE